MLILENSSGSVYSFAKSSSGISNAPVIFFTVPIVGCGIASASILAIARKAELVLRKNGNCRKKHDILCSHCSIQGGSGGAVVFYCKQRAIPIRYRARWARDAHACSFLIRARGEIATQFLAAASLERNAYTLYNHFISRSGP